MKSTTWGILAGSAAAVAFLTPATADADTSWTADYTLGDAGAYVIAPSGSVGWGLPATFTHGDTTLTGIDFVFPSAGGYNDVFTTGVIPVSGAIYAQDQLLPGLTNLYYDPSPSAAPVDMLKTPFGEINMSWAAPLLAPYHSINTQVFSAEVVAEQARLVDALQLGPDKIPADAPPLTAWTPDYAGIDDVSLLRVPGLSSLAVEIPDTTWTPGVGTALTGTDYVSNTVVFDHVYGSDNEFVTNTGAVYDEHVFSPNLANLYYDGGAAGDHPVDMLQTPLGDLNLSWAAALFTPEDYANATTFTALTGLQDAGLYSALDLGV